MAVSTAQLTGHIARLSLDPSIQSLGGFRIKLDDDTLFAAGKTWTHLERVRRDDQWIASMQRRIKPTSGARWEVEAASDDEADLTRAAELRRILRKINLREWRQQMLNRALGDGLAVTEIIWESLDGRLEPAKLKVKPAEWFRIAEDGGLLFSPDGNRLEALPDYKFIDLRHMADEKTPYGLRLAAVCYYLVHLKKHAWKFEAIYAEKFSIPAIKAKYDAQATDADVEAVKAAIRGWASDMGLVMPDTVEVDIIAAIGKGTAPHEAIKRSCDAAIAKAITGSTLTVESSSADGKGTQALGTIHQTSTELLIADDAASIEEMLNTLTRWWCELNEASQVEPPRVRLRLKEKELDEKRNQNARDWAAQGLPIAKAHAYELAMIPPPAEDEELLTAADLAGDDPGQDQLSDSREAETYARTDSVERRALAAEDKSDAELDRFEALVMQRGADAVGELRRRFERHIEQAADGLNDPIDTDETTPETRRMAEAIGRWYARLLQSEAQGPEQKPLSAAKKATLVMRIAKWADTTPEAASGWLEDAPVEPALVEAIYQLRLFARLMGMDHIAREAAGQTGRTYTDDRAGLVYADEQQPFEDWAVRPEAAIQAMKRRRQVSPDEWKTMTGEERAAAFSYAHAPDIQLVTEARDLLQRSIEDGSTLREFKGKLNSAYARLGLGEIDDWYAETIFRTNLLTAYGRGRFEMAMNPAIADAMPYLAFRTVGDEAVRPEHAILEGVYRRDDEFWASNWPPLDFNCRCGVQLYSEGRLAESGKAVRSGADVLREAPEGIRKRLETGRAKGFGQTEAWR